MVEENPYDIDLLKPWVDKLPDPKKFEDYRKYLINSNVVRLDGPQFGFIKQNIEIAKQIPKKYIVIDVGCGVGWQQVLYQKHKKYIGINYFFPDHNIKAGTTTELWSLFPTAYFYQGLFYEVIEDILAEHKISFNSDDVMAIAYTSLTSSGEEKSLEGFKQFKNKFMQNGESLPIYPMPKL